MEKVDIFRVLINMQIKKLFKIILGSSLQWYDFALYGLFSTIFAKLYFPAGKPELAMLATLCTFAIGFIARPFGALMFGRLGDVYGRTHILKITPILITIPTVLLAFIPTYASIGIFAPILLILNRIFQGIFLGAEFGGNMVYLCESSAKNKFFLGSLGSCSGSFGMAIASMIATWIVRLPQAELELYGWRVAFALSIIPGFLAWKLRKNLEETKPYQDLVIANKTIKKPIKDLLHQKIPFLIIMGILCFQASSFYYVFMFLPNYMHNNLSFQLRESLSIVSLVLILRLTIIPLIGRLADLYSGLVIYYISIFMFFTCSFFLSNCIYNSIMPSAAFIILGIMTALNAGVIPGIITEIFPTRSRYTLFSFAFNTGFGIFGGCTPALCFFLSTYDKNFAFLVPATTSLIGLISIVFYYKKNSLSEAAYV